MAEASMLKATGLACVRGERCLFEDLSFELGAGQCLHVAGDNGAGKTSLLRILVGLLEPSDGVVEWKGRPIGATRDEFAAELAFVGHLNGIKDELTVLENARFAAAVDGADPGADVARAALAAMDLEDLADEPVRHLSQGQRRRVALARLCVPTPAPLWILDEPFNALDAQSIERLHARIAARLATGGIVVLTAHQAISLPAGTRRLELRAGSGA